MNEKGFPVVLRRAGKFGSNLMDTRSRCIPAICAGIPGIHTEPCMASDMPDSLEPHGLFDTVRILTGDTLYGNTVFLCKTTQTLRTSLRRGQGLSRHGLSARQRITPGS